MPLIIGDIDARIELDSEAGAPHRPGHATPTAEDDAARIRRLAAERFARERKINQRDPRRLGGE
ncbi:hypothetical protein BE04_24100 [Sorangium cellulosum]|uniref:Uncharacterized protein n=2 Tax=Sorangium cellulosum TaxID=56 RepID=A0A150P810_SORCE|nr:hypothetical protein [Sorangium cellulosum]AGP35515.1 hypothetical protein SCE1572_13835 [Sorangium cellulosum So0157-2]KYF51817.1 hypothetical protein BE04_24100 [Sorangium cellulosum]KYF92558.1 hypothetical protein BE18_16830 [Sorangium cellulosum]KYG02116.1 hypothetical protein BE20_51585 [Sorangium cellulosum]